MAAKQDILHEDQMTRYALIAEEPQVLRERKGSPLLTLVVVSAALVARATTGADLASLLLLVPPAFREALGACEAAAGSC